MKDQELYDYFTSRKHLCDEMPPADLWSKISSQLQQPPSRTKFWSAGKIILLVLAIIITTAYLFWINFQGQNPVDQIPSRTEHNLNPTPSNEQKPTFITLDSVQKPDSIKKRTIGEPTPGKTDHERTDSQTVKETAAQPDSLTISNVKPSDTIGTKVLFNKTSANEPSGHFYIKQSLTPVDSFKAYFVRPVRNSNPDPKTLLDSLSRKLDSIKNSK